MPQDVSVMTEEQWRLSADPDIMISALRNVTSSRKWKLFGCACCRRFWHLMPEPNRRLVEVLERYVDGQATEDRWSSALRSRVSIDDTGWNTKSKTLESYVLYLAAEAVETLVMTIAPIGLPSAVSEALAYVATPQTYPKETQEWHAVKRIEAAFQAELLRDVFGPLARPLPFHTAWLTDEVRAIAQSTYDNQNYAAMPKLADALERAGCRNEAVLGHCRGTSPHVRGCWVIDLLLGKS